MIAVDEVIKDLKPKAICWTMIFSQTNLFKKKNYTLVKWCVRKEKPKQTLYCDGVLAPLCFACDTTANGLSLLVRLYNNTILL